MERLGRVETGIGGEHGVPHRRAYRIAQRVRRGQEQRATQQTAADACETKPGTLLVGEHGDSESSFGANPPFPEKIDGAQRTDHAKRPIKGSAVGNGIEMASGQHRPAPIKRTVPPSQDVACGVELHGEIAQVRLLAKPPTTRRIRRGPCEAAVPA